MLYFNMSDLTVTYQSALSRRVLDGALIPNTEFAMR